MGLFNNLIRGSGVLRKGQHSWNISVTKEARMDPKHIGPNIWMEFATIGEPYLVEGTTPGYPPPLQSPEWRPFFFYGTHPYASKHADSLATQSTTLNFSLLGISISCASSDLMCSFWKWFQETGFLFTPCHTTREVFLLFLLNLEKEALDFHGSIISLFINNVWSHGP